MRHDTDIDPVCWGKRIRIPQGIKPTTSRLVLQPQQIQSTSRHQNLNLRAAEKFTWWSSVSNPPRKLPKRSLEKPRRKFHERPIWLKRLKRERGTTAGRSILGHPIMILGMGLPLRDITRSSTNDARLASTDSEIDHGRNAMNLTRSNTKENKLPLASSQCLGFEDCNTHFLQE
jgi:hypothetical protein